MSSIAQLISNNVPNLYEHDSYAVILGLNPSKGARSPLLWNAAFADLGISSEMFPMDVAQKDIENLLVALEQDDRFIGGAVAIPYKEYVAEWLLSRGGNRLSDVAGSIGAVNCLYRNSKGELCATNTDGEGALVGLQTVINDVAGKTVVLLGLGGAGKAVAAYISHAIGSAGNLSLAVRSPSDLTEYGAKIGATAVGWPPSIDLFKDCDVLINCTGVGYGDLSDYSPLADLDNGNESSTKQLLGVMPKSAVVYDIIYDPSPTKLLGLAELQGLQILDGTIMNLEQAVLGFNYAVGGVSSIDRIRSAMETAKSNL
jgi:shikimate dehydrogenase